MRLRPDDTVMVIKGRDRGKQGRVQQVLIDKRAVVVDGVNVVFRHMKAQPGVRQAGIIQKEMPISVANVMLICTSCTRPSRVGYTRLADGTKARICKSCQEVIE
ncbi:MAG: 50S ribosomal protein L24 [Chloroflexi bacterium]|nr:50S ribosomal protein L24 [Chloroflexota bacterium]